MPDFYVAPYDSVGSFGSGSQSAPLRGLKGMKDAIVANTINAGDRVILMSSRGVFGPAEQAADAAWVNATAAGTGLTTGGTSNQGVVIGSAQGFLSDCCGITFDFRGDGGQAEIDMSTASGNTERQSYAILFRGEDMRILYPKIKAAKRDYVTAMLTTASGGQPETLSYENIGLAVYGAGNTIVEPDIDGGSAFSRYGMHLFMHTDTMSANHSKWKKTQVLGGVIRGSFMNLRVDPGGPGSSGSSLKEGTELLVRDMRLLDPCWGKRASDSWTGGGNAASHGGCGSISGNFKGRGVFRDNYISGPCQDGMDFVTSEFYVLWNTFEDIIVNLPLTHWTWNGSQWVQTTSMVRYGNACKMGLPGVDGTPPTSWLGVDGVNGGTASMPEALSFAHGNKIRRCSGYAFTNNGSKGIIFTSNDIEDAELGGIGFLANSGTAYVAHNYIKLKDTAARVQSDGVNASPACIDAYANTRIYLDNNILDSQYAAAGVSAPFRSEVSTASAIAISNSKNILVRGRAISSGAAYVAANDYNGGAATSIDGYVSGSGFPLGHALQGQADMDTFRRLRASLMTRDANKRRVYFPANPGPYGRPSA